MSAFTSHRASFGALAACALWVGCASTAEPVSDSTGIAAPSGAATVPAGGVTAGAAAPGVTTQPAVTPTNNPAVTTAPVNTALPTNTNPAAPGSAAPAVDPNAAAPGMMAAAAPAGAPTFHKDIRPIMTENCSMACHGADPKLRTGPVALDTYANVKMVGAVVVNAVMSNRMPPWPPDEGCRDLRDHPAITKEQRALFKAWQDAGFPEGNEADYVAPKMLSLADNLGPPTRIITMAAPHTPPANTDEYTCVRPDYTFEKDTYVRAIEVLPDQKSTVHHVQVHVVSGSACTTGDNIYSWRPGGQRLVFSQGDAALIKAGSSFNFQMHYNTIGKMVAPDKTQIAVWEYTEGKPQREVTRVGVFALPPILTPGAVETSTANMNVGGAGTEIIGVSPHAHMIAKTMTADLKRAGGKTECLTKISDWSFEWQMDYLFKEPLALAAGDSVEAKCGYDNSVDHQPTVDGKKREQPITVTPGEGTSDEMCLHYIWLRRPVN
ncbi:MAG TPA: hypothetical protein VFN67_31500 [Polyangiales bacterium]|nr:hypothetical protein [Polyangiales bacterium]